MNKFFRAPIRTFVAGLLAVPPVVIDGGGDRLGHEPGRSICWASKRDGEAAGLDWTHCC
jgi:hypothetical protein